MPSPKSGKAGSAVAPMEPGEALEADDADPGKVAEAKAEQVAQGTGKYGSTPMKPYKKDPEKTGWIEIELVDEDDQPVPGAAYEIELPDGSVAAGSLDNKGFARVEGFDPGECKVSFTRLDQDAWEKA
jgi:type VI secretion system secreted protein VgrG